MGHRLVGALAEVPARELGESSVARAVSTLLRITTTEAHRRLREAEELGPRRALTGQPLAPVLTNTAAAQARGLVGAEHVRVIGQFFERLPGVVDYDTRQVAEAQLASLAGGSNPTSCGWPPSGWRWRWIPTGGFRMPIGPGGGM